MDTHKLRNGSGVSAPFAALLVMLTGCGTGCGTGTDPRPTPPNLLLVVFDTTRADHLGCYGHSRDTSPTVDALAAAGLVMDSAWSASSLTPVSAGAFLTGQLPFRHGVRSLYMVGEEVLAPGVRTIAERLRDRGYLTGGFVSAPPMSARYDLDRGFDVFSDETGRGTRSREARNLGNAHQRRADATTNRALTWLDTEALAADRPFAMLVHYFDAHDATLVPPRAFLQRHVSFPLPADLDARGHLLKEKDEARRIELYDAEIRWMDHQLSRILKRLDAAGVRENTLVVFLADHGEGLGQHGFWTHGLLWGEQLRVPLILAGPGVPRATRLAARVRLVDLLPTLAELLDLPLDGEELDGISILPLLAEHGESAPRELYAEVHHAPEDRLERDVEIYALTFEHWKYVHRPASNQHELYDLGSDPGEEQNLYTADHPVADMLLRRIEAMGATASVPSSTADLDPADIQMLKDLGYL